MKELKAKTVSLIIKIVAVVFMATLAIIKWLGYLPEAVFGDVSINTALDKFKSKGEEE